MNREKRYVKGSTSNYNFSYKVFLRAIATYGCNERAGGMLGRCVVPCRRRTVLTYLYVPRAGNGKRAASKTRRNKRLRPLVNGQRALPS
jgi:hypothetical protein